MVTEPGTAPGTGPQAESSSAHDGMNGEPGSRAGGSGGSGFTVTIPTDEIFSTAVTAVLTPIAVARRVLPAKGGLPLYAGLGGLALIGVLDWPVAVAAGAGYGLARLVGHQDPGPPGPPPEMARH